MADTNISATPTTIPLGTYIGEARGLADRMTPADVLRIANRIRAGVIANPIAAANMSVNDRYQALLEDHRILQESYDTLVAAIRALLPPEGSQAL
jgi:hypothetical protein